MLKTLPLILTLLTVINATVFDHSSIAPNTQSRHYNIVNDSEFFQGAIFLSITMSICYIMIFLTEYNKSPMVHQTIILIISVILGCLTNFYHGLNGYIKIAFIESSYLLEVVMPLMIFKYAFVIDAQTFFKFFNEISIMAFIGISINVLFLSGLILPFFENYDFCLIMICAVIYSSLSPMDLNNYLNDTAQSRDLIILLEGERILGNGMLLFAFKVLFNNYTSGTQHWLLIVFETIKSLAGGLIVGFIIGKCLSFIFRASYESLFTELVVTIVTAFLTFYLAEKVFFVNGILSVSVVGVLTSSTSTSINSNIENILKKFWETLGNHVSVVIMIIFGVNLGLILTSDTINDFSYKDIFAIIAIYVDIHISRFATLLITSQILLQLNKKITWQELLIAVWFNCKDNLSLLLTLILLQKDNLRKFGDKITIHLAGVILFSNLINGICMKHVLSISGLSEISVSRLMNMNMCLQYIVSKKEKVISVLKMNRLMTDVNWPVVLKASTLNRPYKMDSEVKELEHEVFNDNVIICQNCNAIVVHVPSTKEITDFKKEVSQRILIAKKTSYNRHFEEGTLTKGALLALVQAVDSALYSDQLSIDISTLAVTYNKQGLSRWMRSEVLSLFRQRIPKIKAPNNAICKLCYDIVIYKHFNLCILIIISVNTLLLLIELSYPPYHFTKTARYVPIMFNFIYFIEFVIKILAFSSKSIFFDSFLIYFEDHWNKLDFVTLILCTIDIKLMIIHDMFKILADLKYFEYISFLARSLRTLRLLRLLTLAETALPKIIAFIDYRIDKDIAYIYDIGKGFVVGEEEIAEAIQIIENPDVRNDLKSKSINDRLRVMKQLAVLQKNRPAIIKTVKTHQAINFVLHYMTKIAYQLKNDGLLEKQEFQKIMDMIHSRYKYLRDNLSIVEECPPNITFKYISHSKYINSNAFVRELQWADNDDKFSDYVYNNVKNRLFDTGDVIIAEGDRSGGIFIIISGLFKIVYRPCEQVLKECSSTGLIPIIDFIPSLKFNEGFEDFILPGNTIGELSMITRRPYNCTIIADMPCQVYFLNDEFLKYPVENATHITRNLESKIWKIIASRIAHFLLSDVPAYQSYSNEELNFIVEKSFVPSLERFNIFLISDMIKDVLLIYGAIIDSNTKETYSAPCYIPRNVRKFEPDLSTHIDPKILIIPSVNVTDEEIMEHEYEVSQVQVSNASITTSMKGSTSRKRRPKRKITNMYQPSTLKLHKNIK